jgi:hypothetical protein
MRMIQTSLTNLAKIKIWTYRAFISDTLNIFLLTTITCNTLVNYHMCLRAVLPWQFLFNLFWSFGLRFLWKSWSFRQLLLHLRLYLRNNLREHLFEFLLNHWILQFHSFFLLNTFLFHHWNLWPLNFL